MNETKICPVCENEIPEDARFLCPHCHFELKWLDDENAVEKAGKILKDGNQTKLEMHDSKETIQDKKISKFKHLLPGILVHLAFSASFEMRVGHFYGIFLAIFGLPVVLVGGIISYFLEKIFKKSQRFGSGELLFLLPIILIIVAWIIYIR